MATITIEVPDEYVAAVDERVKALELNGQAAYLKRLIRKDVNAVHDRRLAELINEGLASGDSGMTTEQAKAHLLRRHEERLRQKG